MRISRIYLPLTSDSDQQGITLSGDKAHYIRNVLRLKPNHRLRFFIPSGMEYEAIITAVKKHEVELSDITPLAQQPKPATIQSTLIQGISSSDRMDYSIQKAAELGCVALVPVLTEFCAHKIPANKFQKKQQHWQAVAISACEQSGRADLMHVHDITTLNEVLQSCHDGIYLDPKAKQYINQLPKQLQSTHSLFIGPEGGFSPTELEAFEQQGLLGIQLGQRVLRTETMAPVVLAALHTLYGDFRPPTG